MFVTSVISTSVPPVGRSNSRVSNRPPANMEKDENGKSIRKKRLTVLSVSIALL